VGPSGDAERGDARNGRLNGWKEIAAYLGKSSRTAIRWEKELGLPVRRIGTSVGVIVFAFRPEIDSWQASAEPRRLETEKRDTGSEPAASPLAAAPAAGLTLRARGSPRWLVWGALAAAGGLLLAVAAWGVFGSARFRPRRASTARQPWSWRIQTAAFQLLDADGTQLWEQRFSFDLYPGGDAGSDLSSRVVHLEDIDGDSIPEVLLLATPLAAEARFGGAVLYCFDAHGGLRFRHEVDRRVRFGARTYEPPYRSAALVTTGPAGHRRTLWLKVSHYLWFPTLIQKLDDRGRVQGEYWVPGHASLLRGVKMRGREVMLVGSQHNDGRVAALSVLDADRPSGSAPTLSPSYACEDCPPGRPRVFLLFPRSELSKDTAAPPVIRDVKVGKDGRTLVEVGQVDITLPGGQEVATGSMFYTFDAQWRLVDAEVGDNYRQAHVRFELLGRLHHRFGPQDEAELLPVLSWTGETFTELRPGVASGVQVSSLSSRP
jgi:hypothetical protein